MKQPKVLIGICLVTVTLLVFGVYWSHHTSPAIKATQKSTSLSAWDVEQGDTNNEVLRTIAANQQEEQKRNQALEKKNAALEAEMKSTNQANVAKATESLESKLNQMKSELQQEINDKVATGESKSSKANSYPIGGTVQNSSGPIGNVSDMSNTFTHSKSTSTSAQFHQPPTLPSDLHPKVSSVLPMYTIPSTATAPSVSLMTALIGEVPVSGHLLSPAFPFKAIIGRKQILAANGMKLPPNLSGIVLRGYSVGNMTLSCVRAYVTQMLFVFQNGHFEVYPKKVSQGATSLYPQNSLGYLSTQFGNPCMPGKYITDAPKVIANLAAMGGLSATGQAFSQAQLTNTTNGFQTTSNLTGSLGKYAAGSFVNGAASGAYNWYEKRVSGIFDAVYIPAAFISSKTHRPVPTQLTMNFTQTIPINLNKNGRKLDERTFESVPRSNRLD